MLKNNVSSSPTLEAAINWHPLTVSPDSTIQSVIWLMSQHRANRCQVSMSQDEFQGQQKSGGQDSVNSLSVAASNSTCVLIMEGRELKGILTERDIVKLTANGCNLTEITVAQVMVSPVISLKQSESETIFTALSLFRQHRIRHLPVFDPSGQLRGVISAESIRACLQPRHLMQMLLVSEIMATPVITASPSTSVLELAVIMATHRVSSIVIAESGKNGQENLDIPVGIVTEGDILQCQALQIDPRTTRAADIASGPVFCTSAETSVWEAHQVMKQRYIRRLAVTGSRGELLGMLTQTSILNCLDPMKLYGVITELEEEVSHLQAEKLELLETRNCQLEKLVAERTEELQVLYEQERVLGRSLERIRHSIDLQEILNTTVVEVRQLLNCDRVLVYQFSPDWDGKIVAESVGEGWKSIMGEEIDDPCFRDGIPEDYWRGNYRGISDIYNGKVMDCYLKMLEQYQVRANLVGPILIPQENQPEKDSIAGSNQPRNSNKLWGLLIAHQCSGPRGWEKSELELLNQLSVQIAIAIQQAELFKQVQTELVARQQAETAQRETEKLLNLFYESATIGICICDKEGRFLRVNPAFCRIGGWSAESLIGEPFTMLLSRESYGAAKDMYSSFVANSSHNEGEWQVRGEHGEVFDIYMSAIPVQREDGEIFSVITVSDITERKKAERMIEETAHQLAKVIETVGEGITLSDGQGKFIIFNSQMQEITGYSQKEANQCDNFLALLYPDEQAYREAIYHLQRLNENGENRNVETTIRAKEGTVKTLLVSTSVIEDNNCQFYLSVYRDITDRKIAEMALRESQKRYRAIVEDQTELICRFKYPHGWLTFVNEAYCRYFDWPVQEAQKNSFLRLVLAEDREKFQQQIAEVSKDNPVFICETTVVLPRGEKRILVWTTRAIFNSQGVLVEFQAVGRDITEQKQAEAAVKLSEQRYRSLVELSPDGIFITQKGIFQFVNSATVKMLGYSQPKDLVGKPVLSVIRPDFHCIVKERIRLLEEEGKNSEWLWEKYLRADGSELDVEVAGTLTNFNGEIASQVVLRDITLRKQAEAALRKSEEQYRRIVETAMEGIWLIDENNQTSFVNQRMAEMLGYSIEEMLHRRLLDFMEADRMTLAASNLECRKQGIKEQHDFKFRRKDGSYLYAMVSTNPFIDDGGNYVGALAMITDITERKQAEEALQKLNQELEIRVLDRTLELAEAIRQLKQEIREREQTEKQLVLLKERLQYLLSASPTVIYSCKISGDYGATFVSDNITAMLGYEPECFIEDASFWKNHLHPEDKPALFADLASLYEMKNHSTEYRFLAANGEYRWIRDDLSLIVDADGIPLEVVGSMIDITQRKQVELSLQKALDDLEFQKFALDQAAMVAITDVRGVITYANDKFCEVSQYSKEELVGNTHYLINSQYHSKDFFREMWETISSGKVWKGEVKNKTKNGNFYWVDTTIVPMLGDEGKPLQYLAIRLDITERKKAEEDLRKSEERFALAVEGVRDGIWDWDIVTKQSYFSPQWKTMLGCSVEEISNNYEEWEKRIHPEDKNTVFNYLSAYLGGRIPIYEVEHRLLHKDGSYRWILARGAALRDANGKPYRMAGSHTDITERKHFEESLAKHRRYLSAIVEVQRQLLAGSVNINLYKQIIQIMGPVSNASRVYVFENHRDVSGRLLTSQKAEWCAAGVVTQKDNPDVQNFPYEEVLPGWCEKLAKGEFINGIVAHFPEGERLLLEPQNIQAILLLPLIVRGDFFGFIGFDNCWEAKVWEPLEVSLLSSAAAAISVAKERQLAQESLQQQLAAVEAANDGIAIINQNSQYIYLNNSHLRLFGYEEPKELIGKTWQELYYAEEIKRLKEEIFSALATSGKWQGEARAKRRDGSTFAEELSVTLIQDVGLICVCRDVTERKQVEQQIKASLHEKEVLLKEIHHRVKNNLQIISSLLKLQSRYTQDRNTLDMLRESQNRVKSMALIHEKLYQSSNLARIDFCDYIKNLSHNLLYSYSINSSAIQLEINVRNTSLNIDTAIPCGLLINELVSNALKHAFPEGRNGKIWINFYPIDSNQYLLEVKDNGVGLPPNLDLENTGSLGLRLVHSLVSQIDGELEVNNEEGTVFKVTFSELIYKQRS